MNKPLWRRFKLTSDDKPKEAFLALVKQKGLTCEDLMLILKATPHKDRASRFAARLLASFPSSCTKSP